MKWTYIVLLTISLSLRRVRPASPPADEEVGVVRTVWRRVTLVLELIQHSCHLVTDVHLLVPVLFGLLSKLVCLRACEYYSPIYMNFSSLWPMNVDRVNSSWVGFVHI